MNEGQEPMEEPIPTTKPHPRPTHRRPHPITTQPDHRHEDAPGTTAGLDEPAAKEVFLIATFSYDGPDTDWPVAGMAEDVVAVMGVADNEERFAWIGSDPEDSFANPALVTPVRVELGLPSPWHAPSAGVRTGPVPLTAAQLGSGSVRAHYASR